MTILKIVPNWEGGMIQNVTNILHNNNIEDVAIPQSFIIHEEKQLILVCVNITSYYQTKYIIRITVNLVEEKKAERNSNHPTER